MGAEGDRKIELLKDPMISAAKKASAFVILLVLRVIRGGGTVRIGILNAKGKISIMVSYIEPYVRRLILEGVRKPLVIVVNPGRDPNEQLTKMYKRKIWLMDEKTPLLRRVFHSLFKVLKSVGSASAVDLYSGHTTEFHPAWNDGEPVLQFTSDEKEKGRRLLRDMGMPGEAAYVCFCVREKSFYSQFQDPDSLAIQPDASKDTFIRNPILENYMTMAAQCAQLGMYVLRMGFMVDNALASGVHPRIIDYATKFRSDFGDVYLLANCKFMVTGGAGVWWVSSAFNRPVVMADQYLLYGTLRENDLFIPKKLWLKAERRFLTFSEMLAVGPLYMYEENCHRDGIEVIHNSAEEISGVVNEMIQRLDGDWKSSQEDEELQQRFKSLYPVSPALRKVPPRYDFFRENVDIPGRIGADFLRQYKGLLR
jgi:putative glycosyltransferase (TIGR04372 family)